MKLWPGSLSGRLIIILLAGLVLAQGASLLLHFQDRGRAIYRMGGLQLSDRIANVVRQLEPLDAAERRKAAGVSSSRRFRVSVIDRFAPLALEGRRYRRFAHIIRRDLQRQLGDRRAVDAVVTASPSGAFELEAGRNGRGSWPPRHRPLLFVARVALSGGAADFLFQLPGDPSPGPSRLLWPLGVLLVSVVALVLFAVRQTTRPLSMLSAAAGRLGDDINEPPLPETGPREVANAARAFNRMQRSIQDYVRQRGELLAAVSHDLKTPITRLRIRNEMLDDETLKAKMEADLVEMELLVNEALDFVRGTHEHEAKSPVDLGALIESIQDDFDPSGSRIETDIRESQPFSGRPLALKRCLSNLAGNGLKYANKLRISLKREQRMMVVEFRDDGPGLPEALLERVFEPFYRAESSRSRETGGSGLGLAIARGIARAHGGDITLSNHPGGGLVARLSLPRRDEAG